MLTVWGSELVAPSEFGSNQMVSWSRHQARVKRRVLNLAQCEHESDVCLRLLALQEEEEEEPAHYKLLPLYEGYLEHRKIRFQKSPIATRAGAARRVPSMA